MIWFHLSKISFVETAKPMLLNALQKMLCGQYQSLSIQGVIGVFCPFLNRPLVYACSDRIAYSVTGSTESWFFPVYCLFCLKKSAASNHVIFQITESWLKRQNLIVFYIPPSRASLWPIWGNCVQKPFVCKKAERII